jgi:hypothetical protein
LDPLRPDLIDLGRLLPIGSTVVARTTSATRDGAPDLVAAYREAGERGVHLAVFRHAGGDPGAYRLFWNSPELAGASPVTLDVIDITGQGEPQILLSAANPAGVGRMLYVFASRPASYRMVRPVGGSFEGRDYFGESGYELDDTNGDGRVEILARRGAQVEVYAWDGVNFVLVK